MDPTEMTVDDVALPERLEQIRCIDIAGHQALVLALPDLQREVPEPAVLLALVELCEQIALSASGQLDGLSRSLAYLVARLDLPGLQRWVLTGMRSFGADHSQLRSYFNLENPLAIRSLQAEMNGDSLADARLSLQYFLAGFGFEDIELKARKQIALNALSLRPVISSAVLLLPEHYLALEGALEGAIYLAATAHAIAHLKYSPLHQPSKKRKPLLLAVLALIEDARVERIMGQSYPGLYALWGKFHTETGAKNALTVASLTARLARAIHDPYYEDPHHWVNKGKALFEECAGRLDDLAAFNEIGSILANDLGQMRVQFVPQLYQTYPAYRDDNSVLWEFESENQEAPDDEALARNGVQVEREDNGADDATHVSPTSGTDEQRIFYPEWDYRTELLRKDWVSVIDIPAPRSVFRGASEASSRTRSQRAIARARSHLLDRALRLRRQHDGEDLDIDAAIECYINSRGRITPDPRIFQRTGKRRRHLRILLLLDLSESTNDRVGGSYTSVLDLEKQAADILAKAINPLFDRIAIDGFASNGRGEVRYQHIKYFDEPYEEAQQHYLRQQRGALSTRMGAALRHAGTQLAADPAEKQILLIVTDGEPSDIDVVDKAYLVEDARHAVKQLTATGIDTFCLTLDKRADSYVRSIFGTWNFQIVDNATSLPFQVKRAFERVSAR